MGAGTQRPVAAAQRAILATGMVAGIVLFLAGCAGATVDETAVSDPAADGSAADDPAAEAPEECAAAFPQAIGSPSLSDVEALPADWPAPPAGSTLCITASALGGGGSESLSYATEASKDAVLEHYEGALAGFAVSRETAPTGGDMLVGDGEGMSFQIRVGDGTILIALAASD